ncbi:hypothetical protein [Ferrimonas marina]|uniref:Secreted protein n=1 Tax=Ferrimonas marina TaxID=299255 RepID=A0A1M5XRY4_9GAMM|nr:hypothetical protein [Ferrimonas marina]SHI02308.1 hypothetical protein SAMN02745129_3628 [Ferrimonas marina]
MKAMLVVLGVVLMAGCASTEESAAGAQANNQDDDLICRQERTTGSNIRKRRCRTKAQIEQENELAKDQVNTILSGPETSTRR